MNKNKEFINISNKYLADALVYLNFRYYKFTDEKNKLVFVFKNTQNLNEALNILKKLKIEYSSYNKN